MSTDVHNHVSHLGGYPAVKGKGVKVLIRLEQM